MSTGHDAGFATLISDSVPNQDLNTEHEEMNAVMAKTNNGATMYRLPWVSRCISMLILAPPQGVDKKMNARTSSGSSARSLHRFNCGVYSLETFPHALLAAYKKSFLFNCQ
jgi:hypothetical protein